jgi:stress response protein YsnF
MTKTKTITLELTPYEQETLLNALNTEAGKWFELKTEVLLGNRPNVSYEGADMLYKEAKGLKERVSIQVSKLS